MTLVYKVLRHMGKAMPLPDSGLCRYDGFNDAVNNINVVCMRTPAHPLTRSPAHPLTRTPNSGCWSWQQAPLTAEPSPKPSEDKLNVQIWSKRV